MELGYCLHVAFAITFLHQTTGYGYGYDEHRVCLATPKLNFLADYTNVWKSVRLCHRVADSKSIMDDDGRLYLSYTVPIGKGENFGKLKPFNFHSPFIVASTSVC